MHLYLLLTATVSLSVALPIQAFWYNFGTIFKHYTEKLSPRHVKRVVWGGPGVRGRCRTQPVGDFLLSSPAWLSAAALGWEPQHLCFWVACILLIAEDWSAQSHKMCPVGYLRRGVVDTTNACYPVGDTVCNLYTIYKRSRARSSAHLTVAVFCPDWLLLWM